MFHRLGRTSVAFAFLLAAFFFFHPNLKPGWLCGASAAEKIVEWKPAGQPMLRVNDRAVGEEWSVYLPPKKVTPLLVKIGPRFLLVDGREHKIFEVPADQITHKGADLYWDPAAHPGKPLETSDWLVKDVGLAYKVSAKLVAENRVIDVQIPHPMDLRPIHP